MEEKCWELLSPKLKKNECRIADTISVMTHIKPIETKEIITIIGAEIKCSYRIISGYN